MRRVSSGNESGRIMYRTVEPRTVIESRVTVSRDLGVYLTARSATFMRGDTEVMVPFTIVPVAKVKLCLLLSYLWIARVLLCLRRMKKAESKDWALVFPQSRTRPKPWKEKIKNTHHS
jgi:hypothetical protein